MSQIWVEQQFQAQSSDNIVSVDISTAASPTIQDYQGDAALNDLRALAVDGSTAYVSSYSTHSVVAVDVSDPSSTLDFVNAVCMLYGFTKTSKV